MRLYKTIVHEIPQNLKKIMFMNFLAALAGVSFIAIMTNAAQTVATEGISMKLAILFLITSIMIHITHNYTLVNASADAEQLIHKLRTRLMDLIRRSDLVTVQKIGLAHLQNVITQDTQVLAQILPLLVIGLQQGITLVFLALFLAYLSPLACLLAFGMAIFAVFVRFARVKAMEVLIHKSDTARNRLFDGLTELLKGFKEVRLSGPRAEGLTSMLAETSQKARDNNILQIIQWGKNFAVIESLLYSLVGIIVFIVPLFESEFYEIVMPVTLTVLFISGPVSTISFVTPLATQAEISIKNIESMEGKLLDMVKDLECEKNEKINEKIDTLELNEVQFAYRTEKGDVLFKTGSLNAAFEAGKITFLTGGNGSGKSTLLKLLTGLIPIDSGKICFNGKPVKKEQMQDYRDKISAIFSDFHLSKRIYNMGDNTSEEAEIIINEYLKRLEISEKVKVENGSFSTTDLSTGQRKRLAYLVAELEDKPIIVLDEWAADQDPHFRAFFYETLLPDLKARGKIIICVTHDERWFDLADKSYHMEEGRINEVF